MNRFYINHDINSISLDEYCLHRLLKWTTQKVKGGLESPHWRFSLKKVITSADSKSSNSSGFNPILQKFYDMICEIIVSKTMGGIFLIFCRSSFINNFMVKNNFLEPKNHRKLNISRPIYFKKISAHRFVDLICTKKLEEFFFFFIFFEDLELFPRLQNH